MILRNAVRPARVVVKGRQNRDRSKTDIFSSYSLPNEAMNIHRDIAIDLGGGSPKKCFVDL